MKAHRGSKGMAPLTLKVDSGWRWGQHDSPLPLPPVKSPGTHRAGSWVGPQTVWVVEKTNLLSTQDSDPRLSHPQLSCKAKNYLYNSLIKNCTVKRTFPVRNPESPPPYCKHSILRTQFPTYVRVPVQKRLRKPKITESGIGSTPLIVHASSVKFIFL